MIQVIIIEDEAPARKKLHRFLNQLDEEVTVLAEFETVTEAVDYLQGKPTIDLILSDIQLRDGHAFEIYSQVEVCCPIIFTTAYDQFWMEAFETNGIAYLLKPFSFERFQKAWNKYRLLGKSTGLQSALLQKLQHLVGQERPAPASYKSRLAISSGKGTYFLEIEAVLYFIAEEGIVMAVDKQAKKHLLTQATLKEIEALVDPKQFFRINRSELVHKRYIERMERYNKNTIALKLSELDQYLVTSQSSTAAFRQWVED
jgi:DNA-binding LytR/AlgR family response regulator